MDLCYFAGNHDSRATLIAYDYGRHAILPSIHSNSPNAYSSLRNAQLSVLHPTSFPTVPTPTTNATPNTAREKVFYTAELLEMILGWVDARTLLTSVLRVDKTINAAVNTSPRLQSHLFRSLIAAPSIQACSHDLRINDVLRRTFLPLGKTSPLQVSFWCVTGEEDCGESPHGIKIKLTLPAHFNRSLLQHYAVDHSWRKLRLARPRGGVADYPATITIMKKQGLGGLKHDVKYKTLAADLTLGEFIDWAVRVVSRRSAKRCV